MKTMTKVEIAVAVILLLIGLIVIKKIIIIGLSLIALGAIYYFLFRRRNGKGAQT